MSKVGSLLAQFESVSMHGRFSELPAVVRQASSGCVGTLREVADDCKKVLQGDRCATIRHVGSASELRAFIADAKKKEAWAQSMLSILDSR